MPYAVWKSIFSQTQENDSGVVATVIRLCEFEILETYREGRPSVLM